jgi:DNA-binding NtrC family response regulator
MQRIVIVHEDSASARAWAARLAIAGHPVATAATFEEGKALMTAAPTPPALLIASVKLGAFNGLHLVIRGRLDFPQLAAILTSDVHDAALAAESARHGALYLAGPIDEDQLMTVIARALTDNAV